MLAVTPRLCLSRCKLLRVAPLRCSYLLTYAKVINFFDKIPKIGQNLTTLTFQRKRKSLVYL